MVIIQHILQALGKSAFLAKAKSAIFGVLSALVKDSRQFKQRENRRLKVVTVNLPLYKQHTK